MNLKCPYCGFRKNPMNAIFCGKCGEKILKIYVPTEKSKAILSIVSSLKKSKTISRNDLCPCGSGKRYKNCHGKHLR